MLTGWLRMAAHNLLKLHVVCQWRSAERSVLFSPLGEFQRTFNAWTFVSRGKRAACLFPLAASVWFRGALGLQLLSSVAKTFSLRRSVSFSTKKEKIFSFWNQAEKCGQNLNRPLMGVFC